MAQFQVAAVFSDHCVLQRNKNISIFGYGENEKSVQVALFNKNGELLSKNSGKILNERWEIQLEPQSAQEECRLEISETVKPDTNKTTTNKTDGQKITFTDISIGEVWLAGGQSNMEFELHSCTEGPDALKETENPNVRFYYTNKIGWKDEHFYEAEKNTCWQTWDSEYKTAWSAVGFFFAKKLAADLGCTVGVIGCNWGGTSASAWMRKEFLEKDDDLRTYITEQIEGTKGKSIEQQCKEYDDYEKENAVWQEKCNKLYATVPGITWAQVQEKLGACPWPGPRSCKNPYRPTGLYDCMLSRILPYTLKGVIWYQGESDDHKPGMYYKLFSAMIDNWRTDWHDETLPFVFVQLPGNRYEQDKDFKHWCFIREAQEKIHNTIKNAWMTCALELGVFNDIHPKAKRVLAERMEQNALANVYNKIPPQKALSPMLDSTLVLEDKIILTFTNADDGFTTHTDEKTLLEYKTVEQNQGTPLPDDFTGFEVAGSDGIYYPAEFAFGGTDGKLNTITVKSKKVPEPKFARYAWYNYGPAVVFSKNGLPLAPFRTSPADSQAATEHAEIQQIMTV